MNAGGHDRRKRAGNLVKLQRLQEKKARVDPAMKHMRQRIAERRGSLGERTGNAIKRTGKTIDRQTYGALSKCTGNVSSLKFPISFATAYESVWPGLVKDLTALTGKKNSETTE